MKLSRNSDVKVVAIIQARMGSTRLPGKVLKEVIGQPMLTHVIERAGRAQTLNEIVVATTTEPADEEIVRLCNSRGYLWFKGNEIDVLGRYYHTALAHKADVVVRITSDCPLIDPEVIDRHVNCMVSRMAETDFVTNMMQQTFPLGLAVEALPVEVLSRMNRLSGTAYLREHVTTLAYEKPELFLIAHILNDTDLSAMRWTVDTAEDLAFVRQVFDYFGHNRFGWHDVLAVLKEHPEWMEINQSPRSIASADAV